MSQFADSFVSPASAPVQSPWIASMPWFFVILWSTGFIVAKFGLPYAPPLTFLVLRFAGVLVILVPCLIVVRAPWPAGQAWHIAIAGIMLQAGYLSGVWWAIRHGMPAGLSALIVGMQPILTGGGTRGPPPARVGRVHRRDAAPPRGAGPPG